MPGENWILLAGRLLEQNGHVDSLISVNCLYVFIYWLVHLSVQHAYQLFFFFKHFAGRFTLKCQHDFLELSLELMITQFA